MTVLPAPALPPVISSPSPALLAGPHEPGSGATAEMLRTVRVTNLITWAALSVHSLLVEPVRDHLPLSQVQWWGVLNVIFLAGMLLTLHLMNRWPWRALLGLLAGQSVLALTANAFLNGSSVQAGLLILVAAQVGLLLPFRQALLWVAVQSGVLLWVLLTHWHNLDAWAFSTGYVCFQALAITTVRTAMREIRARRALATVVEELRATRALLNEASRQAERLQISRELHDLLGHHLTGLGMHLQVAAHLLPASPARTHVQTAQGVAQQLLGDVRTAVRGMRDTARCDFPLELRALAQGTDLDVHVTLPPDFRLDCPVTARVLLRCAQEIVTNAARHARASQVWLDVQRSGALVRLRAHDDGPGVASVRFGCGLSGMRERLEGLGGTLDVQTPPGQGVTLCATLPAGGLA
ncbi:sensor histidine kinase [Deinococcus sp. KSM4-11]|uniref:sensor histidine kinase n=1 Tax=Deinococcus sp. KSM4-11 TaxID=2568654 RepID=UPI0010A510A8|nr:sensor histidine kinase [Deinococcus sp. KSM4-11]THF86476.1 sensor histidine kinase [Deinococcus sp. KSM4-11]